MAKKIVSLILSLYIAISMVFTGAAGYTYAGSLKSYDGSFKLEWFEKDKWEIVSGVKEIIVRNVGSSNLLYVTSDKQDKAMTIAYESEEPLDLSAYNEIVVGFVVNIGSDYLYEITYYCEGGIFSDTVAGDNKSSKNTVHFKLPPEASDRITKIEITVDSNSERPSFFTIDGFYADNSRTYSYAERFMSRRLTSLSGAAQFYDDYAEIIPDENGALIECELMTQYKDESVFAVVEVSSPYAGMLTVENPSAKKTSSTAMYAGTAKYSILISGLQDRIRIGFSGSENSDELPIRFVSLKLISIEENKTESLGTIDTCTYEKGKITVKGTVDSETIIENINSDLALYKIPYDHSGELPKEAEVEMSISTEYKLEVPVSYDHTQYKYVVALKNKQKVVPLTDPVYAVSQSSNPAVSQDCDVGIHNAESSAVFESEVNSVIVDVYTDHLFASSDTVSAIRFAYRDNVYYLNSDYINEISSDVSFYASVGRKVYVRLLSEEKGSFGVELSQKNSVDMMCAAAAYLGSNYVKVEGIIVLTGFDYSNDLDRRAKEASELLGLFTSALRSVNSNTDVITWIPGEMGYISSMLAMHNKRNGFSDTGVIYECQNINDCVSSLKAYGDAAKAYGASFGNEMIFLNLNTTASEINSVKQLYESADQGEITCVVFSVSDSMTTDEVCSLIENIHEDGHIRDEFTAFKKPLDHRGEYTLWDFTQSYDTYGWLAGGSCFAPETQKSAFGDKRVLKSNVVPTYDTEGILVGWFDGVTDLTYADIMKVELAVDGDTHKEIPVSIVLGGNGAKAEFITTARKGDQAVYFDINSYKNADKVEYIAIIINSSEEIALEISKVSILSHNLADNELKAMICQDSINVAQQSSFYIFAGAIISSTIVIFIALSKKKSTRQNGQ